MVSEFTLEDDELREAILEWLCNNKNAEFHESTTTIRWHLPAEEDVDGLPRPTVVYNDRD